jgi:hypothetical protein
VGVPWDHWLMLELQRMISDVFLDAVAWGFVIIAIGALLVFVPRLCRRAIAGTLTPADRVAATVLMVAVVLPVFYVSVPFSEGPYRCTAVVHGAEGRQTVYPDDAPRATGELALLQRRQQVCDDAAKARGVTAGMTFAAGLLLATGISTIWRRMEIVSDRHEPDHASTR